MAPHLSLLLLFHAIWFAPVDARPPYELMKVPYQLNQTGNAIEQVFLEYQCHTVQYDENVSINMTVVSSDFISFSADKCGKRIFETTEDIKNATYILSKEWVETILTGIANQCTLMTEYAVNFTIGCTGPCNGTIFFDIIPNEVEEPESFEARSNPREGIIPIRTVGGSVPTIVSSDIGFVIEAVFMNARLRIELDVEYTTNYTLAIGKCGMEMLRIQGDGTRKKHVLGWEEIKLLRIVKSTQCAESMSDTIDYIMTSEKSGNGSIAFLMARSHKKLEHHPGNEFESMELARGFPKHKKPKADESKAGTSTSSGLVASFLFLYELFAL
ncbi:unnamed protein product [Caenorhabditis sp. 36 PRJEB53466]|nr:unnamed protein product [Caenorhabditis sp. 36 PRJEB53466]